MNLIELVVQLLEEEGYRKADNLMPGTYHFGLPDKGYREAVALIDRWGHSIHISNMFKDSIPINAVLINFVRFPKQGKRTRIIDFNDPDSIEEFKEAVG
jgi:hypothetical protein